MKNSLWQRLSPHVLAIAIFFVVSVIYCLPAIQGLVVEQFDLVGWKGMAQQSFEYREQHGRFPLWTNSMFSGMPAFQIAGETNYITIALFHHLFTLFLPSPASLFFLACVGFYILCQVLRLNNRVSIFGSLGYAFASYSAIIAAVGHTTKFASMGYAPAVLAGLILLTQRRYILGFISTLLFCTLLFYQNHLQIVYYTFLMAVCLGIGYLIYGFRKKQLKHVGITAVLALTAGALAVGSYAVVFMSTYDYSNETMRGGKSELTLGETDEVSAGRTKGGLDKNYAFDWSYGIAETFTIVVPRMFGGSTPHVVNNEYRNELGEDTRTAEVLSEQTGMAQEQANDFVKQFSSYWGGQPSPHSGAVYYGAVMIVAFIFGLIFYNGWHKGWLIAATLLGFFLAWGKNFSSLNYFLFDYLPFYNKFRAPSMALVIPQLTIPLIAALGLQRLLFERSALGDIEKRIKSALSFTGGIVIIVAVLYFMLDYRSDSDNMIRDNLSSGMLQQMSQGQQPTPQMEQQATEFGRSIVTAMKEDRKTMFRSDLIRSFIFIALTCGLFWFYFRNKVNGTTAIIALTVLAFVDLMGVNLRYLNLDNYVDADNLMAPFGATPADLQIKQDTGYYRVYDMSDPAQTFNSSRAAYHHNAVGGYHPAKLGLYNDLIRHQLSKGNMQVFNMLNTKYFIVNNPATGQPAVQQNPDALGPAWFVRSLEVVEGSNEEMLALDSINTAETALMQKSEHAKLPFQPQFDSSATIVMNENLNDRITYTTNAQTNQFAVFSEVYYPRGWKAFIDGKETPIVKVNYTLRGLAIPAGQHKVEFIFEPTSYLTGMTISKVVGVISFILLFGGLYLLYRRNWKEKEYV